MTDDDMIPRPDMAQIDTPDPPAWAWIDRLAFTALAVLAALGALIALTTVAAMMSGWAP